MLTISSGDREALKKRLLERSENDYTEQQKVVDEILEDVRRNRNAALFSYIRKFDRYDVTEQTLEVSEQEIKAAFEKVSSDLISVMEEAAENIREFHNMQRREDWILEKGDGSYIGQRYLPVERAGVYVPGGKAAYPSSVLMNIIPAKCAGVGEICVATPAMGGVVNDSTVVAARIAGADRIFKMGGAQAVAAFAYGTESVPRVDKITGPGNIYVALAKKQVYGTVGIDMIAGPSEVLVIADRSANAQYVAADILSQAEHDEMAASILVTNDADFAEKVKVEIERQTEQLVRKKIIRKSLDCYGTVIICDDMEDCIRTANLIAPEHLEICTRTPEELLPRIKNAGSIFLGEYSPEPLGDYFAGTNHVLPTNGTARFSSPLNVDDFQKKSSVIYYTKELFEKEHQKVKRFAEEEGLTAHARSAMIRFEGNE